MKIIATIIIPIFVLGCATARKIKTPDGNDAFIIKCNGAMLDWGHCYQKASEVCEGRKYEIIERNDNSGFTAGGSPYSFFAGSVKYRNIIIKCGGQEGGGTDSNLNK